MLSKTTNSNLTLKQEAFAQAYVRLGDKSAAYREAYKCGKMKPLTINNNAYKLFDNNDITTRIAELTEIAKQISENEFKHSLSDSLKLDMEIVEKYKKHISVLENPDADYKEIEVAKRTIQFIGINGFNAAQDRVSKKLGFYEKDNEQRKNPALIIEDELATKERIKALLEKRPTDKK